MVAGLAVDNELTNFAAGNFPENFRYCNLNIYDDCTVEKIQAAGSAYDAHLLQANKTS